MESRITSLDPPRLPKGFVAAGTACGIKKGEGPDIALLYSETEAAVAGAFTSNRVAAAPVKLSRRVTASGRCRAVIANSGCANAPTGARGESDARRMAARTAQSLGIDPGPFR